MSIVSVAEAVPNRLFAIYGTLLSRNSGEKSERLKELMVPKSLRGGRDNQSTALFDASLREARNIGLIVEDADTYSVTTEAQPKPRQAEEAAFRTFVLKVLYEQAFKDESSQSKVAPALAWLLMQNPLRPIPWSENPLQITVRQLGEGNAYDLTNAPRLQTLAYWARYLGFARLIGAGEVFIVPDPHDAISRLLPDVFDNATALRATEFRKRLSDLCPLLEDGLVRTRIERQALGETGRSNSQRLSRTTSLALVRLESCGRIQLEQRSDAEVNLLDLGTSERRFSHISIAGRQ
jgi:hypothetical protein